MWASASLHELAHFHRDDVYALLLQFLPGTFKPVKHHDLPRFKGHDITDIVKPILSIKEGCSEGASCATLSHTGALAGVDKVYDGAFSQAGIIRAEDIDDLFEHGKGPIESTSI